MTAAALLPREPPPSLASSLTPAAWPREDALAERLLRVDLLRGRLGDGVVGDLGDHLRAGDLLVVNDAATLPGALAATSEAGEALEVRLAAAPIGDRVTAVLLGGRPTLWRTPTELRVAPPRLGVGARLAFALPCADLAATVVAVWSRSARLVELRFDREGAPLWSALYRAGRPVQYSHVARPLALWHVQTAYGGRPWAVETPSAGRPLRWSLLLELGRRGVRLASLTHGAGLSATGDAAIDAALPLPERFDIPAATVRAIDDTRAAGGRVIAVGTSVTRALEGAAAQQHGQLVAGEGVTDLRLGPGSRRRIVDGLLTGLHEPGGSHHALLHAFAPAELLARAHLHTVRAGYLAHEFGDSCLLL